VAAGAFEMQVTPIENPTSKARLSITWTQNERWQEWSALSEGCYLLRTNLTETDPAVLWKRHLQLTEAEWTFRITKDELEIRPIFHQHEERVLAHILVFGLPPWSPSAWRTCSGRPWPLTGRRSVKGWPSGCGVPGWATRRGPSSKSSPRSRVATWF
jgi:hypothetical protein